VRQRYYVAVSILYVLLGVVIVTRSLIGHVVPIALLGVVFIALGAVRLREYFVHADSRR
jgi:uncharacterized membrane protein HdeD (DUF308 family)